MQRRAQILAAAVMLTAAVPAAAQVVRRKARPSPSSAAAQAPADVALLGVTQIGNRTQAWLVDLRTQRRETVTAGDAAFGFRVKRIAGESVVLSRGGKELTVRLGEKPIPPRVAARPPAVVRSRPAPGSIRPGALPPVLTPEGELPLRGEVLPETAPPTAGSSGEVEVVPNPTPVEPEPVYPYPNVYPGYPNPLFDPYSGQFYGYPGFAPAYDPYTGQLYPYPGAFPGYYPEDPYGGYYPGYGLPVPGYAPYGPGLPGSTGFSAPWGAYPNQSGTGPISGGLRWNPQTRRRSVGRYLGAPPNPQTRRRRGY